MTSTIQFKLDKRTLGTIHLNAITRIYGDHGLEVLELLRKNPAGKVVVVVVVVLILVLILVIPR